MNEIGRILSTNKNTARAEFTEEVREGMLVAVMRNGDRYLGRIDRLETTQSSGISGYIYFIDQIDKPFKSLTSITIAEEERERGILHIGNDHRGLDISLNLNPLFSHLLVSGITQAGKTHLLIVLCEELLAHKIPALVIDPQGEMRNLPEYDREGSIVLDDLRIEELKPLLQQRKIVVYNLLGYPKRSKVSRVAEILNALMAEKEKDYQQANGSPELLELPPTILMIDESDLFAPNFRKQMNEPTEAVRSILDIMNRGAKFGLGCFLSTQRITRLDIDARSQCNSAILFRFTDAGSLAAVYNLDYIPWQEIERLKALPQGQALIIGKIVNRPRIIQIRDIRTRRAKDRDFEKMLGIRPPMPEPHEQRTQITESGDVVDEEGIVVDTKLEKLRRGDQAAFKGAPGDGVLKRTPDEQAELELSFKTHISDDEVKLLRNLRKPDEKGERLIG